MRDLPDIQYNNYNEQFIRSVKNNNLDRAKQILQEHNIDINYIDKNENNALHFAILNANIDMIEFLTKNGANNQKNIDYLKFIVDRMIQKNNNNLYPLDKAFKKNDYHTVQEVINYILFKNLDIYYNTNNQPISYIIPNIYELYKIIKYTSIDDEYKSHAKVLINTILPNMALKYYDAYEKDFKNINNSLANKKCIEFINQNLKSYKNQLLFSQEQYITKYYDTDINLLMLLHPTKSNSIKSSLYQSNYQDIIDKLTNYLNHIKCSAYHTIIKHVINEIKTHGENPPSHNNLVETQPNEIKTHGENPLSHNNLVETQPNEIKTHGENPPSHNNLVKIQFKSNYSLKNGPKF